MIKTVPCRFTKTFEELDGSPVEELSSEITALRTVRNFKCAWEDRIQLAVEFVGYTQAFGTAVVYHYPHQYTVISSLLVAVEVSIKPFGKTGALTDDRFTKYNYAELIVTYQMPRIETSEAYGGAVTINEQIHGASEFITLPTKNLFWGKAGEKVLIDTFDAPGKVNQMIEWIYNIRGARILPNIQLYPGRINKYASRSTSLGYIFPPTTLLMGEPIISKETSFDGVKYDLTLRFLFKNNGTYANPRGWNYFPRVSNPGIHISWERITDGTNDKEIYEEVDFGVLII